MSAQHFGARSEMEDWRSLSSVAPPRPRIVKRLSQARACPIILIIAPAGFGKTTALRHLLSQCDKTVLVSTPRTATLEQFILAFALGCSACFPEMASPPQEIDARNADKERNLDIYVGWAITHLGNAKCIIAVDDLQNADGDPDIATFLIRLADLSKGPVQWVLSSRTQGHLPIVRWQINGDADAPVTADELCMTFPEASDLASSLNSPVTADQLFAWVEQTRGFPVPLAYAIRLSARRGTAVGIIDGTLSVTFDFLAEQLWESLPSGERTLLEVASFLPALHLHAYDFASIDNASSVISHLCDSIAFLSLGQDGTFSMHDLFRDFVRQRILHSGSRKQHARCATAVSILVKSQRYVSAFELLIEVGDLDSLTDAVEKLPLLSSNLPVTRDIVKATSHISPTQLAPELLHLHTSYYSWFEEPIKSRRLAEEIISRSEISSRHLLCAILSIYRVVDLQGPTEQRELLARLQKLIGRLDDTDRIVALAVQAALLARFPETRDEALLLVTLVESQSELLEMTTRLNIKLLLATTFYYIGNFESALRTCRETIPLARSLNDTREIARTLNYFGVVLLHIYDSEAESVFEPLREAVEKTGSWRYSPISHWLPAKYYALKADYDSAKAALRLQSAVVVSSEWQRRTLAHVSRRAKNLCHLINEDYGAVIADFALNGVPVRLDYAYEVLIDVALSYALTSDASKSEVALRRARQIRESFTAVDVQAAHDTALVEVIALCAIGRWKEGRRLHQKYRGTVVRLHAVDLALGIFCDGPPFIGLSTALQPCLGRPYVGLASLLMQRVSKGSSSASTVLNLSAAEMMVLRLIALGRSNKEIAATRSRSAETVKRQVASLYKKLGVENRTSAVAVARERGLL